MNRPCTPCQGPAARLAFGKVSILRTSKAALCGKSVCNQRANGETIHRHCGFVHTESTTAASSTGRRTDCAVGLEPASSAKKKPHPTDQREAGQLHRPSFLDARTQTRREVVLGLSLSASLYAETSR